jgi:hypothetical protein
MAIISFPDGIEAIDVLTCAMCKNSVTPVHAVIGPHDSEGRQVILCGHHLGSRERLVSDLVEFKLVDWKLPIKLDLVDRTA